MTPQKGSRTDERMWRIVANDLRIELRSGQILSKVLLFAVLLVVSASMSLYLNPTLAPKLAAGVLWITLLFSSVLTLGKLWERERSMGAFDALRLTSTSGAMIFAGKTVSALLLLAVLEIVLVPLLAVFMNASFGDSLWLLMLILSLGTLGLVSAGTLFASMSVRTEARDLVVATVLFPLLSPALLASVVATRELLNGAGWSELRGWLQLLAAFDITSLALGGVLFDSLHRE